MLELMKMMIYSEYAFGVLGGVDNPDNGRISMKIDGVQVTMTIFVLVVPAML